MSSILEEFARGNISPERLFFNRNSDYGRLLLKMTDSEEKLVAALIGEQKELWEEFISAHSELNELSGIDRFIYGYRLGVFMTMEVFEGKENLIVGKETY